MPNWTAVESLAKSLGLELDNLQTQLDRTRSVYDELWKEITKPKLITTSTELVEALKNAGNYELAPGAYVGNFQVLAEGVTLKGTESSPRLYPGVTAAYTLTPYDKFKPALSVLASQFLMRGISVAQGNNDRAVLTLGSTTATLPEQQPNLVILDRIEVVAGATGGKRGIEAHTRNFILNESRVTGFYYSGADSQAFLSYNGPGPYFISDNELEASGENILFGGATTKTIEMIPSNVKIVNNTIRKPLTWQTLACDVKNSIEFKCVKGAVVENNTIDGCWKDAQDGHMIVITPRNQYGTSPFAVVEDIIIRHNRTINHLHGYAVNILLKDNEYPSELTKRITIDGNLFQDSRKGIMVQGGIIDFLRVTDNTFPGIKYNLLTFAGDVTKYTKFPLTYMRNVALSGDYGANSDSLAVGKPTLEGYTTSLEFTDNVIEKTPARYIPWPDGNTLLKPGELAPLLDPEYHYKPGGAGW